MAKNPVGLSKQGRLVKWYNSALQKHCRGFDSSISRTKQCSYFCVEMSGVWDTLCEESKPD